MNIIIIIVIIIIIIIVVMIIINISVLVCFSLFLYALHVFLGIELVVSFTPAPSLFYLVVSISVQKTYACADEILGIQEKQKYRPARTPGVVLAVASHESLTVRFFI